MFAPFIFMDERRHSEQLRIELEPRTFCGVCVYVEANLVILNPEIDDPTTPGKAWYFAYCQDRNVFEMIHKLSDSLPLARADENNMAILDRFGPLQSFDDEASLVDPFVPNRNVDR